MTQPLRAVCPSDSDHGNGTSKKRVESHWKEGCTGNSKEHINVEECSQEKRIYRGGRKNGET